MQTIPPFAKFLLITATLLFAAGLGTWVATGTHVGWTQTSTVTLQRDEITGIDYPVRQPGFVAGIEIPVAASAVAVALAAFGLFLRRPRTTPLRA